MKKLLLVTLVTLILAFGFGTVSAEEVIYHSADTDESGAIELDELMRIIQLYNGDGFHCFAGSEDGYGPGSECVGSPAQCQSLCPPRHSADWADPQFWISLSELLRMIQLFGFTTLSDGYVACPDNEGSSDGFCPRNSGEGEEGEIEGWNEGEDEGGLEGEGSPEGDVEGQNEGEMIPLEVSVILESDSRVFQLNQQIWLVLEISGGTGPYTIRARDIGGVGGGSFTQALPGTYRLSVQALTTGGPSPCDVRVADANGVAVVAETEPVTVQ